LCRFAKHTTAAVKCHHSILILKQVFAGCSYAVIKKEQEEPGMSTNALHHDNPGQSHIMTATAQTFPASTNRQPPPKHNDDGSITAGKEGMASTGQTPARKVDKQSAEYLIKSGLAGGLAGCAVRPPKTIQVKNINLTPQHRQKP
jgi:hypothetical protein